MCGGSKHAKTRNIRRKFLTLNYLETSTEISIRQQFHPQKAPKEFQGFFLRLDKNFYKTKVVNTISGICWWSSKIHLGFSCISTTPMLFIDQLFSSSIAKTTSRSVHLLRRSCWNSWIWRALPIMPKPAYPQFLSLLSYNIFAPNTFL